MFGLKCIARASKLTSTGNASYLSFCWLASTRHFFSLCRRNASVYRSCCGVVSTRHSVTPRLSCVAPSFPNGSRYFSSIRPLLSPVTSSSQTPIYSRPWGSEPTRTYDVAIVGGGIVGAAVANELAVRHPNFRLALVEKEKDLALHQSGNSSGVIHAGIYYSPGSLMAQLCVQGLEKMYEFCQQHDVPHSRCGKLVVATERHELERLDNLYTRGLENQVPGLSLVEGKDIKSIEPYCEGLKAIHSPHTGIVDYAAVARKLGELFSASGGHVFCGFQVGKFDDSTLPGSGLDSDKSYPITLRDIDEKRSISCRYAITCGGLFSDRLSAMTGCSSEPKIVPFRGDFLLLKPDKNYLVKGNIYPVPDPRFPFLGFHFTPRTDGSIFLGPNAVFAFKREGYSPLDFSLKDFTEAVCFRGTQQLILKNFSFAMRELYYGLNLRATVNQLKRFIPQLEKSDVIRGPSGVRAQALSPTGGLISEFVFDSGTGVFADRLLHVRNAPSPAATASLSIAKYVADEVEHRFKL